MRILKRILLEKRALVCNLKITCVMDSCVCHADCAKEYSDSWSSSDSRYSCENFMNLTAWAMPLKRGMTQDK